MRLTHQQRAALELIDKNGHALVSPRRRDSSEVGEATARSLVARGLVVRGTVNLYASAGMSLPWPVIRRAS